MKATVNYISEMIWYLLCKYIHFFMIPPHRYFIFTSFWAYKIYYVFGFMLLVFLILVIVTVCVTIVCTYFLLNAEDYRWQWTSFLAAASTALYVYMYSFYYFVFKTKWVNLIKSHFCFYKPSMHWRHPAAILEVKLWRNHQSAQICTHLAKERPLVDL